MPVQVRFPVGTIVLDPGYQAVCDVAVENIGVAADRFTFEVLGTACSWTTLYPSVLALAPGTAGTLRVHFHPPRAAHVRAGRIPFGLLATSEHDRSSAVVEELLVLGRFADLSAELIPLLREGSSGNYQLAVHNAGNSPVHLTVIARDVDVRLAFRCSPPALTVFPGTTEHCRVRARLRHRHWRGETAATRFQVIARPVGEEPITVVGTLLHRPLVCRRS